MSNSPNYWISSIRLNPARTHIDQLKIHKNTGNTVGDAEVHSRQTIVSCIRQNLTFTTIYPANGKWNLGKPVYVVKVGGIDFLKTVADNKLADNLDNLPEF
ncbi:DUF3892 domain-containing protein [Escherichia coli]